MKAIQFALGSFLFVALFASTSAGQVQRTFVSGLGIDSNPCSRTAPCRTFGQAISQTNSSGEVYVLDSAGYSTFTITKPISIVAPPGVTAGISVFSGDGIVVEVGASDTVILRGLTINNQGSTGNGIFFNGGGTLHVEGCVINGFSTVDGVFFRASGRLEVKDSIIRGCGLGIDVRSVSGSAHATIDGVRLEENGTGLRAGDNSSATVRNSVASGNGDGFEVVSLSAPAEMNIESSVASNNVTSGISVSSPSTFVALARVSNSTVTDNVIGLGNFGSPAVLLSRGNNTVEGNTTNMFGTIGSYSAK